MPTRDNSVEDRLQLYSVDGENYTPVPGIVHDMTIANIVESDETDYTRNIKLFHEPISFTGTLKLPHSKMSKKTFKKWLMGHKISRDDADWLCWLIATYKGKVSYSSIYAISLFMPSFNYIFDAIMIQGAKHNG